jgi:hypothetical protein
MYPAAFPKAMVDQLEAGVTDAFAAIQGNLVAQLFSESLPLLGDNLAAAAGSDIQPLLHVAEAASSYLLETSPLASPSGPALYYDSNATGVIEPASDELIAIWTQVEILTTANALGTAMAAQAPNLAVAGLEGVKVVSAAAQIRLEFIMADTLPPTAVL